MKGRLFEERTPKSPGNKFTDHIMEQLRTALDIGNCVTDRDDEINKLSNQEAFEILCTKALPTPRKYRPQCIWKWIFEIWGIDILRI